MNVHIVFSVLIFFLHTLYVSQTIHVPITPILQFLDDRGSKFEISEKENDDLSTYKSLLEFLPNTMIMCYRGIWRFYPLKNFTSNETTGIQIGDIDQFVKLPPPIEPICIFPFTSGEKLATMMSYRRLGPDDLSSSSFSMYSENYFGGEEYVHSTKEDLTYIPFPVKSYMITAPTDDDPVENKNDDLKPVYRIYDQPNMPTLCAKTCLSLSQNAKLSGAPYKMYMHSDAGSDEIMSVKYIPYKDIETECETDVTYLPPETEDEEVEE